MFVRRWWHRPSSATNYSGEGKFELIFCNETRRMTNGWRKSSLEIEFWHYRMALILSDRPCNENRQTHPALVKGRCQNQESGNCLFIYLNGKEQYTEIVSHLIRLTEVSFVFKCRNVWDCGFIAWGQKFPRLVDPAPWKGALIHTAFPNRVFDKEIHSVPGTCCLLTEFRSEWLLPFS
jgi:hypothetical protein